MKHADTFAGGVPLSAQFQYALSVAQVAAQNAATATGRAASKLWIRMKVARMQTALEAMSDQTLAKIGVARGDIRRHAEHLITYKYDGL